MTDRASDSGFFFMRHGETSANRDGVRSGGENDTHLTELGRRQAQEAGLALQRLGVTPSLILAAPLSRTLETAELLNARLGVEIRVEPALIERRLGTWNGLSVEATQPSLDAGETPPGGESNSAFRTRVLGALNVLTPLYAGWPLIVSSRGVARILMQHAGHEGYGTLSNGTILRIALSDSGNGDSFEITAVDPLDASPQSS